MPQPASSEREPTQSDTSGVTPRALRLATVRMTVHLMSATASSINYNVTRRNRSAFVMTDTELTAIAALASMGLSSRPNSG
jgi:hypothetical protein